MFNITVDVDPLARFMQRTAGQVPFAMSRALNATVLEAQAEERAVLDREFTIRRQQFITRQIKIPKGGFARKDRLRAVLEVDPRFDLLQKFEAGGRKTPRRGSHLTVPAYGEALPKSKVIPASLRPRALELAEGAAVQFSRTKKTKLTKQRGKERRAGQGRFRTYLVPDVGIFQRKGRGKSSYTVPLYIFDDEVPIPSTLHFYDTAVATHRRVFRRALLREWANAIKTSR